MAKKKFRKGRSKVSERDLDASSAITRAGLFLRNQLGVNISKMKHKAVIREYAKRRHLTIPPNADLKGWIINQFPLRVKKGNKTTKSDKTNSISSQYCEDLRKRPQKQKRRLESSSTVVRFPTYFKRSSLTVVLFIL